MHPVGTEIRHLSAGSGATPAAIGELSVSHTVLVVTPSGDGYCAIALPANALVGDLIEVHLTDFIEYLQFHCPEGEAFPINQQFLRLDYYGGAFLRKIADGRWGFIKSVNY
jgi:hypothetical protein